MTAAAEILERALSDPADALRTGEAYLRDLGDGDPAESVTTLRAMSLAARARNQIDQSIELASKSARVAEAAGLERERLLAILTMTGSLAIAGQTDEAIKAIETAIDSTDDMEMLAKFRFQKGAVLALLGEVHEAVALFEEVLPVFRDLDDKPSMDLTLDQLGRNLTILGRLDEAERHLLESMNLAEEMGEAAAIPGIEHNLGQVAAYRGDIPAALWRLTRSDDGYMALSGSAAPQHATRCEVLISAGLFREARDLAQEIAAATEARGDVEHAINARLVAAHAALLANQPHSALDLVKGALEALGSEDSVRSLDARRIAIEARLAVGGPNSRLLSDLTEIANHLDDAGHVVAAGQANLLAGRIARSLGDTAVARRTLEKVSRVRFGPVEVRVQSNLARALMSLDEGDKRAAIASVRSGLSLIDRYQRALGASDLRLGVERHGQELGEIGLRLAVESGRPRRMLTWMEKTRARALRFPPVVPPDNSEMRTAMADLRRVESELRVPRNRGDRALLSERSRLQDRIAAADREQRGDGLVESGFSVEELVRSIAERSLIEIADHDGELVGVHIRNGRANKLALGRLDDVQTELGHLRFAMRRAARRGWVMDQKLLANLDHQLFGDLSLGGGPLTVVPPPSLMAVPWAALPSLRGRPLSVSPSAELWWRRLNSSAGDGGALVAGGPDLDMANAEVAAVGALYPEALVLGIEPTVEDVKNALDGARVAHIACHAAFSAENPMFSSLRLGDGDLNIYDIERLETAPDVVVLSACDSGYTETQVGDELAGLTSALLSMGTRNVVAGIGLVPDSAATLDLMVDFHRGLLEGLEPSSALARAQSGSFADPTRFLAAASFICVGA